MYLYLLGQPVAWAITDVEDAQTYHEFFKAVKWRVPDAVIDTLMTDDGEYCETCIAKLDSIIFFQILQS